MSRKDALGPTYDLPWDASTRDVLMDRVPVYADRDWEPIGYRCRYNLVQELWPLGPIQFGWGTHSNAGWCLAVNILDRWIDGHPRVCEGPAGILLNTHPVVLLLAEPFRRRFLAPIPFWGGSVRGDVIARWITTIWSFVDDTGIDLSDAGPYPEDLTSTPKG